MSTTRIITLLIASALFLATSLSGPRTSATNSQRPEDIGPSPGTVEITFDGLMVFHKNGNHYEVGIVDAAAAPAPHHEFSITVTSNGVQTPPVPVERLKLLGNAWLLEVENRNASDIHVTPSHHTDRTDDSDSAKEDFDWIIDIESREFHDKKLELKPGKLRPIIQISNGELFTLRKTDRLNRKQGLGGFKDFGFVADKIGLKLTLHGNENLVLRVVGAGESGLAFRLPSTAYHTVAIENIVHHQMKEATDPTHFQYYYGLFDSVGLLKKFEFKKEGSPSRFSRAAAKDYSKSSDLSKLCCPYICGQLLLGQMDHPLW